MAAEVQQVPRLSAAHVGNDTDSAVHTGIAEFAALLQRERAAVSPDTTLLVTLNGDFLSGSELAQRCKG
jgi:hypothetical protein